MTDYDAEIRQLKTRLTKQLASSKKRFHEQLAKQQMSYLQLASDALERGDVATAYNMLLNAQLVEKMREMDA